MLFELTWRVVKLMGLAVLLAGCIPNGPGAFTPEGFVHRYYDYQVQPLSGEQLLPADWELDNFYRPHGTLKPKGSNEYMVDYELDYDGDGAPEKEQKDFAYDLRFKHLEHDGVIYLRNVPVSANMERKKLSVLMGRIVEGIAGAGYETMQLDSGQTVIVKERRYATAVTKTFDSKLAGLPALTAEFEVAAVDQLKVNPDARRQRVKLVILHTSFRYKTGSNTAMSAGRDFPVVMMVGYANTPAEYESGLKDFEGFLQRIVIGGAKGYKQMSPPKVSQKRTSAPME